ncbi:hypothetical protein BJ742DRAFT_867947 [Cladochytrium replicatum]|nr:hypothetical protein BJ742DRAFT_867947 [Cladochytrium replicatum]
MSKRWTWGLGGVVFASFLVDVTMTFFLEVMKYVEAGTPIIAHVLPTYYFVSVVIPVICLLPDFLLLSLKRQFFPNDAHIISEQVEADKKKAKAATVKGQHAAVITMQRFIGDLIRKSLNNSDTEHVQLDVPIDVKFRNFASAALSKLELAGHCFNQHSPRFRINTDAGLSIWDDRDIANALASKSIILVEWRVREVSSPSLPKPEPVPPTAAKWTCTEHRVAHHDIFVSYRRQNEGELVKMLVPFLEKVGKRRLGTKVDVFWDQQCLNDAQNWREGFINGLQQSRVIVYLLSAESIKTMNNNVLAGKEDNMLIEIEKGIELAGNSPNVRLCPVLVDTVDALGNVVSFNELPKFDSALQSFSNDQFVSVFSQDAFVEIAHNQTGFGQTLRNTISSLFAHNCIHLSPTAEKLYDITCNVIDLVKPLKERVSASTLPEPPAHFVGRDDVLSEIQKQLVNHGAVVLAAQGGMGKSSAALQFAQQHQKSLTTQYSGFHAILLRLQSYLCVLMLIHTLDWLALSQ